MENFLIYAACCIVFATLYALFTYKGLKKKFASPQLMGFINMFLQGQKIQDIKNKIWKWYTIPFWAVLWCALSLILAPLMILSKIRSLFTKKPKAAKPNQAAQNFDPFNAPVKALDFIQTQGFDQPQILPPGFNTKNPTAPAKLGQRPETNK